MLALIKVSLETSLTIGQGLAVSQVDLEHPVTPARGKLARLMRLSPLQRAHEQGWGESRKQP